MFILKAANLRKEFDGAALFEQISFDVRERERLALIGRNGLGKTTLLHILAGRMAPDEGGVQRLVPVGEWGWLDQEATAPDECPVIEFVQSQSPEPYRLKRELGKLQLRMKEPGGAEAVLGQYERLYERYLQVDGYCWETEVERCLRQMGLEPPQWEMPFRQLSGGQKTKAQLAALMVRKPRFLMLDEPTNHLDAETLDWLEQWVRDYPGTILYVSHDRTFIDRTATAVLELTKTGCRRYPGGYADYREQKELELRTREMEYKKQEQEKEKLLESIRRYAEWFQQAHRSAGQNDFYRSKAKKNVSRLHAKEAALERLESEGVRKPREEAQLSMRLEAEPFAASTVLRMERVAFAYDGREVLFEGLDATIRRGDRIAVLGPNGSGKSTLLKLACGMLRPASGTVRIHPQTRIGYFAQELDNLDAEATILDSLLALPGMTQTEARTILGCFLFPKDDAFKRIGELSMGEKCRVAFLKLLFGKANLLVLDEPTNYLDIPTRERVEEAVLQYPGAILLVTHDRRLVQKVANRLIVMEGRQPTVYPGSYDEYRAGERGLSPERQREEDERRRLEWRLAQLMAEPEPEDPEEREGLMGRIREAAAAVGRQMIGMARRSPGRGRTACCGWNAKSSGWRRRETSIMIEK